MAVTEPTFVTGGEKIKDPILEHATQLRGLARQAWQDFQTNPPEDETERPDVAARTEFVDFIESNLQPGTAIMFSGAYETITHETYPATKTTRQYHTVTDQEATIVVAVVPGGSDDPEIMVTLADKPDEHAHISLYKVSDFQIIDTPSTEAHAA